MQNEKQKGNLARSSGAVYTLVNSPICSPWRHASDGRRENEYSKIYPTHNELWNYFICIFNVPFQNRNTPLHFFVIRDATMRQFQKQLSSLVCADLLPILTNSICARQLGFVWRQALRRPTGSRAAFRYPWPLSQQHLTIKVWNPR